MSDFRAVTVSEQAIHVAAGYGWPKADITERLQRMAKRSAPATHRRGNRRFDNYILTIEGGVLLSIYDTRLVGNEL